MTNNLSINNMFYPNSNYLNINSIYCTKHKTPYKKYCLTCSLDLCTFCETSHINHNILQYDNISPTKEEISLLVNTIEKYTEDYNKLLLLISDWQTKIDRTILYFQNQLKNNNIMKFNLNYINNYNNENINFASIVKFRKFFEKIIDPIKSNYNNKILNYISNITNNDLNEYNINDLGLFSFNKYSICKDVLKKINIRNKEEFDFINLSYNIIDYLSEFLITKENNAINRNNSFSYKEYYVNNSLNNNNIIEKHINLTNIKKENESNKFEEIIKKINKKYIKGNIFLDDNNKELNNTNNDFFSTELMINNHKRSMSNQITSDINIYDEFKHERIYTKKISHPKKGNLIKNIENNNKSQIINSKIIKNDKKIINPKKTFVHKKFDIKEINNNILLRNNQSQDIIPQLNINSFNLDIQNGNDNNDNNILNSTFSKLNSKDKESFDNNLNFEFCQNNTTNSKEKNNSSKKKYNISTFSPNLFDISSDYTNDIKIIKTPLNHKFILDQNKCLCLGLELGNKNCKIGIINRNFGNNTNNTIELICFKEEEYQIPSMIYFDENYEEIKIGFDASNLIKKKPRQVIYDIVNNIGKNYNEIKEKNNLDLLTYNLFYTENKEERPYIKINYNNQKDKIFFYEDLLMIYLKKLFEIFFNKIIMDKEKNNIIPIVLVISIPNYYTYFQRKIIEKIIQTQIFPSNEKLQDNISITSDKQSTTTMSMNSNLKKNKMKIYGGYQILLHKYKIENSSSIACLCLKYNNNFLNTKEKNNNYILLIDLTEGVNINIVSINEKINKKGNNKIIYEILNNQNIENNNFDNEYILNKIKNNLKENEYKELIKNPNEIAKLIINSKDFLNDENNNKIYEININLLNKNYIFKINKLEYEKILFEEFNKIIVLIKSLLKKTKLTENDIDNVLLLGSLTQKNIFKKSLKDLFKFNKTILNKLYIENILENNFHTIIGTSIQSFNIYNKIMKFQLNDIIISSLGIETLDGYMDIVIEKGSKIPITKQKFVKINKNCKKIENNSENYLEINIYEGENELVNKNKNISCANIDKRNFKNEKIGNNYIEILIQFEIDNNYNLCVYILDPKTLKRRFEFLINIDIVKG